MLFGHLQPDWLGVEELLETCVLGVDGVGDADWLFVQVEVFEGTDIKRASGCSDCLTYNTVS